MYKGNRERKQETVVQFSVSLDWDLWHAEGVRSVQVNVHGCSTSSEAITKALAIVRPLREDPPKRVNASMEEFTRDIPEALPAIDAEAY